MRHTRRAVSLCIIVLVLAAARTSLGATLGKTLLEYGSVEDRAGNTLLVLTQEREQAPKNRWVLVLYELQEIALLGGGRIDRIYSSIPCGYRIDRNNDGHFSPREQVYNVHASHPCAGAKFRGDIEYAILQDLQSIDLMIETKYAAAKHPDRMGGRAQFAFRIFIPAADPLTFVDRIVRAGAVETTRIAAAEPNLATPSNPTVNASQSFPPPD